MLWKWLTWVIIFDFLTVYANEVSTTIRSDETGFKLPCEIGWHHFRQKCYKLGGATYDTLKSWDKAANICTSYGGHLVSINSKAELDFLVDNILMPFKYAVWIGLHDRNWESMYSWQDGSPVNFTNWRSGEPNNKVENEDCGQMLYDLQGIEENIIGQWNDAVCSLSYPYICQKKIVSPPPVKDKSENLPNSTSGNLSLEAGIGIAIAFILVLVLLGAGIYKFRSWGQRNCTVQYIRESIAPPVPSTSRPKLHIQPVSTKEDNTYCMGYYERGNIKNLEPMLQNSKSLSQTPVHPSTNNISQQNTKKEFNQQKDHNSYENMGFCKHWDNQLFESSMDKTKSLSQSPMHSSTDDNQVHSTQEEENRYVPMGYFERGDVQNLEPMLPNSNSLSQTSVHPSTNSIPQQSTKREFNEQEDNNYELMVCFESGSDKTKSLPEIPTDSHIDNRSMYRTDLGDTHYEPEGFLEHRDNKDIEKRAENTKSEILFQAPSNFLPDDLLQADLPVQDNNTYETMC